LAGSIAERRGRKGPGTRYPSKAWPSNYFLQPGLTS
jgi:hypothetical protein